MRAKGYPCGYGDQKHSFPHLHRLNAVCLSHLLIKLLKIDRQRIQAPLLSFNIEFLITTIGHFLLAGKKKLKGEKVEFSH
ncbi:hypothetical protein [Neochlamydia sp. AcF95]|uniref:hypothetical protein n=1 Tax=Neochlamydia sp. AcF95 TaxID=2795734 RepID=UPI001BC93AEA|nr:hypothetical protein [Neochlamydia sp. AcF95]MBS4166800.1 hypothetical protein [Neochlamydia sp. AcF65]MBS4170415.1 hypothetical protein [Neochlamydia sp. AcF95]NGY95372.1 hypothetical protein [Neochlamydia sp. AcF84]